MVILNTDIKLVRWASVAEDDANGGGMGVAEVDSAYFPDISGSDRASGLERGLPH